VSSWQFFWQSSWFSRCLWPAMPRAETGRQVARPHLLLTHSATKPQDSTILQDSKGFMWFGTFNRLNRSGGHVITGWAWAQTRAPSVL